jgi:hypothetical protein
MMSTAANLFLAPKPQSDAPSSCDHEFDTILTLPAATGCHVIASACREAALMFLNESAHWGKAELALWLMGPYAQCTRHELAYAARRNREEERGVPLLREIDARLVDRIIASARDEVVESLRMLPDAEGGTTFAFCVISEGLVARCEDARRVTGWLPTTVAKRLADRVLSLIAVDYLMNTEDYENGLFVCPSCGSVSFDVHAWERGYCDEHADSGVESGRATVPYLPEGA